jgi:hypothetical protein
MRSDAQIDAYTHIAKGKINKDQINTHFGLVVKKTVLEAIEYKVASRELTLCKNIYKSIVILKA